MEAIEYGSENYYQQCNLPPSELSLVIPCG